MRVAVASLSIGVAALVVVVAYSAALWTLARVRHDDRLLRLWLFAAVLSLWQVLPDLVLVEVGALVFPPDGVPDIGTVTLPMAGMWAVPTVLVVLAGDEAERRRSVAAGTLVAVARRAGLVYGTAEAILPALGVWEPVGVRTVGWVAPYVLARRGRPRGPHVARLAGRPLGAGDVDARPHPGREPRLHRRRRRLVRAAGGVSRPRRRPRSGARPVASRVESTTPPSAPSEDHPWPSTAT